MSSKVLVERMVNCYNLSNKIWYRGVHADASQHRQAGPLPKYDSLHFKRIEATPLCICVR